MNRTALLDVNVLVALFDATHVHHDTAHDWFEDHRAEGWATCPTTENGFVRILTNPRSGLNERAPAMIARLRTFAASGHHVFWPDRLSLRDQLFDLAITQGHRQLTDVYLLGLAVSMGGVLATFDRTIPVNAVKGAVPDALVVIEPVG